jgi:pyruvate-ferredoxin/flavodoxin oxidoreductase
MSKGMEQQKLLTQTGLWPLYRYNPNLVDEGKNPLVLDSREPTVAVKDYAYNETRYRVLVQNDEARAEKLMIEAGEFAQRKWELYKQMAAMAYTKPTEEQKD